MVQARTPFARPGRSFAQGRPYNRDPSRIHSFVSLIALLLALLAQHAYPPPPWPPLARLYGRACLWARQKLDAGDRNSGIFAWFVLMTLLLVPTVILTAIAMRIHPALVLVLDIAALYGSMRFLPTLRQLAEIEKSLRAGETRAALASLEEWQGQGLDAPDAGAVARVAAEHALREAHQGTYGLLFWFLLLPGPVGVVLYGAALRAARTWEHRVEAHERDFGWFAGRAFALLDWIPQRVSAFAFAIVGDFEDALFCWRTQAGAWPRAEEAVVLAAGAGALEVKLGEPIPAGGAWVARPTLGVGEPASEDALASLEGMLWRALVLWLVVYVLAVALQLR